MKNLATLIICIPIICSCQQKTDKNNSKEETSKEVAIEAVDKDAKSGAKRTGIPF